MKSNQDALFDLPEPPNVPGRHEQMLKQALSAAERNGLLEDVDFGLVSLALSNATALDRSETMANGPYVVSSLTGPYREVLEALRMTPETRNDDANDELARALKELDATTTLDATSDTD